MNASLIWHIVKKDTRQTWMWMAAVWFALAGYGWTSVAALDLAQEMERSLWQNAAGGFMIATEAAVFLFLATLIHAEALCGERAYWLARPVSWIDLLAAKLALSSMALGVPFAIMMAGMLAAEGITVTDHIPALLGKLLVIALCWVLPVAVLGTVTRNLQQMALGLIVLFLTATLVATAVHARGGFPAGILWVGAAASFAIAACIGCAVIWLQYSSRRTRLARILVAVGVPLFLVVQGMIPRSMLFAAQQSLSPRVSPEKGSMTAEAPRAFPGKGRSDARLARDLFLPVKVAGLDPGELVTLDSVEELVIESGGESIGAVRWMSPGLRREDGAYWLHVPVDVRFFRRHEDDMVNIRLTGHMSLHGNRREYSMELNENRVEIPGVGRCTFVGDRFLTFECLAPFRMRPLVIVSTEGRVNVARHAGDRSPLNLSLIPQPFDTFSGYLPEGTGDRPRIRMEVADPQSQMKREFVAKGIRLADYSR